METNEPFSEALRELVLERDHATSTGHPNWSSFAAVLEDIPYETLRRAVGGKRRPSPSLIEACARALGVRPEYFLEYRIHLAQRDFDPSVVGRERAIRNLQEWARVRASAST